MSLHKLFLLIVALLLLPMPTNAAGESQKVVVLLTDPENTGVPLDTANNFSVGLKRTFKANNLNHDICYLYKTKTKKIKKDVRAQKAKQTESYCQIEDKAKFVIDINDIDIMPAADIDAPKTYLSLRRIALSLNAHAVVVIQPTREWRTGAKEELNLLVMGGKVSGLPELWKSSAAWPVPKSRTDDSNPIDSNSIEAAAVARVIALDNTNITTTITLTNSPAGARTYLSNSCGLQSANQTCIYPIVPHPNPNFVIFRRDAQTELNIATFSTKRILQFNSNNPDGPIILNYLAVPPKNRKTTWRPIFLGSMVTAGLLTMGAGVAGILMSNKCISAPSAYDCAGHYPTGSWGVGLAVSGAGLIAIGISVPLGNWYADRRWQD